MEPDISRVASTLVSQSSLFQCSLEHAWKQYMHPLITERFNYKEVKDYIDEKVKLGENLIKDQQKIEENEK